MESNENLAYGTVGNRMWLLYENVIHSHDHERMP